MTRVRQGMGTTNRLFGLASDNDQRAWVASEAALNAQDNMEMNQDRVEAMGNIETTLNEIDQSGRRYGFMGIMDAINNDQKVGTLGSALGTMFGMNSAFSKDQMDQFAKNMGGLDETQREKAQQIWRWARKGNLTEDQQKKLQDMITSGNLDEFSGAVEDLFKETDLGKQMDLLTENGVVIDLYGKDEKGKDYTGASRRQKMEEQSFKKALETSGIDQKLVQGATWKDKLEFLKDESKRPAGITDKQIEEFEKNYGENRSAFGLGAEGAVNMEQVLADLVMWLGKLQTDGIPIKLPFGIGG